MDGTDSSHSHPALARSTTPANPTPTTSLVTPVVTKFVTTAAADPDGLHRALARLHRDRLTPRLPDDPTLPADEVRALLTLEQQFLDDERHAVAATAAAVPEDADAFVAWFEGLKQSGPGQGDPLFPWLAQEASYEQVRWFLRQEVAGEAGFDDLVALTQVKMPTQAKLEMARNYWDEMGRGRAISMHGPLLADLADVLDIHDAHDGGDAIGLGDASDDGVVWEALALSNLMVGLATARRYAFHSAGALGAIELTAPTRAVFVNAALERLQIPGRARRYYAVHATVDVKHAIGWNAEVLWSLVKRRPQVAHAIAEGALLRLRAGARTFERYRAVLGGAGSGLSAETATSASMSAPVTP